MADVKVKAQRIEGNATLIEWDDDSDGYVRVTDPAHDLIMLEHASSVTVPYVLDAGILVLDGRDSVAFTVDPIAEPSKAEVAKELKAAAEAEDQPAEEAPKTKAEKPKRSRKKAS